jgi:CheY-like chemotaxis protein
MNQQVLRTIRILVVDDNQDAANSVCVLLEMLGATATVAYDGKSAIETFSQHNPSVVLLDIGMPGMDGYEVARALRRRCPDRHPTIIALSGWGEEDDRRKSREAGMDRHWTKPAKIEALRALVYGATPPG